MFHFILFNERNSIKTQLLVSLTTVAFVSAAIALGFCIGMTILLGDSAYQTANNGVTYQSQANANTNAEQIGSIISQKLSALGSSISMVNGMYSSVLLDHYGIFYSQPVYKEYNFIPGCQSPNATGNSVKNDSEWNALYNNNFDVKNAVDTLVIQDKDFELMYSIGPNTSVLMYSSIQIMTNTWDPSIGEYDYISVHRTYQGFKKNSTTYNPPTRSWFTQAPESKCFV